MGVLRTDGKLRQARHLCIWPKRLTPRAQYVPEGRTLHILDLENLCGGPQRITAVRDRVADAYASLAGIQKGDHVIMGVNPNLFIECAGVFPGRRIVGGYGPNGADTALLEVLQDPGWIAPRFDKVVIGSGDHCFTFAASHLNQMGVMVGVVAREGTVARSLARAANFVRVFPPFVDLREVA